MPDWTALAGAAGLASALENIQDRRAREADLQRRLTEGQGEWALGTGRSGFLGVLDQLFGYNQPGQIGFGGQTYQFKPYAPMTEQDVRGLGLTMPETTTTPAYERPWTKTPTELDSYGPLELVPEQQTTREVPLPGFVGQQKMTPEFMKMITLEQLKERRELARLEREQDLLRGLNLGGLGVGSALPGGTPLPPDTPAGQVPVPTQTPASATVTSTAAAALGPVPGVENLSPQFRGKAQLVANRLGFHLDDFYRVMAFETGGEFSPATKNRAGSGATGLIQFTPDTAKRLGTTTEALAQMTPEQQLDYVEKYLPPYKGKLGTLKDLYIAVHYPDALGKSDDTVLYTQDKNPLTYRQNTGLDTDKKGYVTVRDAFAAVQRTTGMAPTTRTATAPAPAQERAPAPVSAPAPTDALTNKYAEQFRKGDEAAALKVVTTLEDAAKPDPAHPKQMNPADAQKILAAKQALEQVFPRGPAQEQAAARGDTSMLVAGNAAPAPQTAAQPGPPTTPVTATEPSVAPPFQLSLEGRRQILANNKTIERNEQEIQALDTKQRTANYLAATRKNPQLGALATQLGQRMAELSRQNQSLRDMSERTLQDEAREWRAREEKRQERSRRPGEIAAEKTAERTAEEAYYDTRPVGEHPRIKSEEYFVRASGDAIDDSMLTREMRARNKAGQLTRLADLDQRKQLSVLKQLEPVLKQYSDLVEYAYGTDKETGKPGPLPQFSRTPYATASAMLSQAAQSDPVLQAKRRALQGQLQSVVRGLGARGDLNQQELEAAQQMLANLDASVGLGLSLSSGPMLGTGGFGIGFAGTIKPSISIPDTPEVGLKLANEMVGLVNSRIGSLLRNKNYQGTPAITLPGKEAALPSPPQPVAARLQDMTPDQIRQAPAAALAPLKNTQDLERQGFSPAQADAIRARVLGRAEAELGPPMGQTTPLNPQWSRTRIPQMTPAQIRVAPPEVIADVDRVADIPGLDAEQRKALAARLRQRNEEAVKLRRAS